MYFFWFNNLLSEVSMGPRTVPLDQQTSGRLKSPTRIIWSVSLAGSLRNSDLTADSNMSIDCSEILELSATGQRSRTRLAWQAEPTDVGTYPYGLTVSLLSNAYNKIEERIVKTGSTTGTHSPICPAQGACASWL